MTASVRGDAALVHAVESNFSEAWALIGASAGELHEEPAVRWIAAGDHPFLNAVIETRIDPLPTRAQLESTASEVIARGGSCVWWLLPSAAPTDLAQNLERCGFVPTGSPWPGMAVELDALRPAPPVPGFSLSRVDGDDAFRDYLTAFDATVSPSPGFTAALARAGTAIGFGKDAAFAHFVVRDTASRPVACASLMEGGGAAGLYNVGTVEDMRGRGIGAWVSSGVLLHGRERGHKIGVLQSSPLGYRVYERLGFREICRILRYIRPAPPSKV